MKSFSTESMEQYEVNERLGTNSTFLFRRSAMTSGVTTSRNLGSSMTSSTMPR